MVLVSEEPKPARGVADSLKQSARGTQGYLNRLERLHVAKQLSQRDVTRAYEGAFLTYYTSFERHIERLFIGILMARLAVSGRQARALVQVTSDKTARNIIRGDRKFVDWLPIERTTQRASLFLSEGRPFDRLSDVDKEVLERMRIVRNVVAHRSGHAGRQFRSVLIEGQGIPPYQRTPAGYLRGQHAPGQSRLAYFMAQGVEAMDRICA